jgi:hypothetical protein
VEIFNGPGYDSVFARSVGQDGVYTIVEEAWVDGHCWGKLKSGAGWVMLESYSVFEPYTVYLLGTDGIFEGPGYDYDCVDTIGKDNRAESVEVKRGIIDGNYCEILNAAEVQGRRFVTTGQTFINNGALLQIIEQ